MADEEHKREPRPEKVAVVDEVRERLSGADAALLTDYRGIDVGSMAELRRALTAAGGDYKIYKNSLVRFAAQALKLDIEDMLLGPTAIAFVTSRDGAPGDPVPVAKALRDFARTNDNLEIKGGLLGDTLLTAEDIRTLADVPPREELLARFAGGLLAPLQQLAGLLQAIPRDFAYGLAALIDQMPDEPAPEPEAAAAEAEPEAPAPEPDEQAAAEPVDEGNESEPTDEGETDKSDETEEKEES